MYAAFSHTQMDDSYIPMLIKEFVRFIEHYHFQAPPTAGPIQSMTMKNRSKSFLHIIEIIFDNIDPNKNAINNKYIPNNVIEWARNK